MDDEKILELYFSRSEDAISYTQQKYEKLCKCISFGILRDTRDVEECLSDTWMALWNKIPPAKPNPLKTYVCRVAKNIALKCYTKGHAKKRNSQYECSLEELTDCLPDGNNVEEALEEKELTKLLNAFLEQLDSDKRILFLQRYWFLDSVKDIAENLGITEKNASMRLSRIRVQLKLYLEQEGITI